LGNEKSPGHAQRKKNTPEQIVAILRWIEQGEAAEAVYAT
jgi:hypothetical protein